MEDEARKAIKAIIGNAGERVPVVDAGDMKAMRDYILERTKGHSECVAFGMGVWDVWERVCTPGADIRAVSYRLAMLQLMEMRLKEVGWQVSDAALKVISEIDMTWIPVGGRKGLPFNREDFLARMHAAGDDSLSE